MTDRKKALGIGGVALSLLGLGLFVGNLAGCGPQRFSDGREDSGGIMDIGMPDSGLRGLNTSKTTWMKR